MFTLEIPSYYSSASASTTILFLFLGWKGIFLGFHFVIMKLNGYCMFFFHAPMLHAPMLSKFLQLKAWTSFDIEKQVCVYVCCHEYNVMFFVMYTVVLVLFWYEFHELFHGECDGLSSLVFLYFFTVKLCNFVVFFDE